MSQVQIDKVEIEEENRKRIPSTTRSGGLIGGATTDDNETLEIGFRVYFSNITISKLINFDHF